MAKKSPHRVPPAQKIKNTKENTDALLEAIIKGVREKKGKMIRKFDLSGLNYASTDYFIICHGDSTRQAVAIADSIEFEVTKATGEKPWHVEGLQNAQWVLMDYVNVVVHVFFKEARDFYDIENLWADAAITEIDEEEIVIKATIKKTDKTSVKKAAPKKATEKAPVKTKTVVKAKASSKATVVKTKKAVAKSKKK
jgi:ribosome-associated protein